MVKWCKGALNGDLSLAFRTSFGFALTFSQNISNLRFRFTHLMVHAPGSFQWHPLRAGALHTDHRVTAIIIVELDIVVVAKLSGECVGVRLKSDACLLHPLLEMWNLKGEWRCIYSDIFSSYNSILDKVWAVWAVPELLPLRGGTDTPLRGANLQLQTPNLLSVVAVAARRQRRRLRRLRQRATISSLPSLPPTFLQPSPPSLLMIRFLKFERNFVGFVG